MRGSAGNLDRERPTRPFLLILRRINFLHKRGIIHCRRCISSNPSIPCAATASTWPKGRLLATPIRMPALLETKWTCPASIPTREKWKRVQGGRPPSVSMVVREFFGTVSAATRVLHSGTRGTSVEMTERHDAARFLFFRPSAAGTDSKAWPIHHDAWMMPRRGFHSSRGLGVSRGTFQENERSRVRFKGQAICVPDREAGTRRMRPAMMVPGTSLAILPHRGLSPVARGTCPHDTGIGQPPRAARPVSFSQPNPTQPNTTQQRKPK